MYVSAYKPIECMMLHVLYVECIELTPTEVKFLVHLANKTDSYSSSILKAFYTSAVVSVLTSIRASSPGMKTPQSENCSTFQRVTSTFSSRAQLHVL